MLERAEALPAFVRWQQEGEKHERAGDYAWMAERLSGGRVLEIGCGVGYGSRALQARGHAVLAIEPEADCIAIAAARCGEAARPSGDSVEFLQASVDGLDDTQRARIADFAPEWVVCWLMGAPEGALDASLPPAQAVQKYREAVHRQVAELASRLPSVRGVQLCDRTAFPWKIKDTARQTLVFYHQATTFAGLPFSMTVTDAVYRKLDERNWPSAGPRPVSGLVPVLGALLAHKN